MRKGGKPAVPLGKVGRPGVHHPQAEALDLLGPQPLPIPYAVFIPVALQIGGLGQGVHRVGHGAPQPRNPCSLAMRAYCLTILALFSN